MHAYIHVYRDIGPTYIHASIKYVTLFLVNFDPPVTLCHTSRDTTTKVRHTCRTSVFSRPGTKISDKSPLCIFYLNCSRRFFPGGFVRGYMSGRFCPGWFLSVAPSITIHLLQQKVKHHFKF